MTVHTSSSPPVKDYGGELGLFPVNDPDPAANGWKTHFLVFASTCLFCVSVFFSVSMIMHSNAPMSVDFSEKLLEGRVMMREVFEEPEQVEELKCSPGYHLYAPTKKCLKAMHKAETLHAASLTCLEDLAFVSSLSDAKEAEFLVNMVKKTNEDADNEAEDTDSKDKKKLDFWIGLVHVNDKWLWLDRSPVKYVNWEKGMPSKNATDKCVVVQIGLGNQWKNMDCHKRRSFVCEKAPIV